MHVGTTLKDLKDALTKDGMPLTLPTNDLRKSKAVFIQHAIAKIDEQDDESGPVLSKSDKYNQGLRMWMELSVRAVLTMSKKPGFALVTTRGN